MEGKMKVIMTGTASDEWQEHIQKFEEAANSVTDSETLKVISKSLLFVIWLLDLMHHHQQ